MFEKIKKGVELFKMAFEETSLNEKRILDELAEFKGSAKRQKMITGLHYYDVENEGISKVDPKTARGKANNKLAHANYKNIVDEKVAYAFSKQPTLRTTGKDESRSKQYIELVKDALGKYWEYEIETLGYEASNKGIAWIHPYIDEKGQFKMFVPPSEQIIPIWSDSSHFNLDAVIRFYNTTVWSMGQKKQIELVEVWTDKSYRKYRNTGGSLLELDTGLEGGHYLVNGKPATWGKVPFAPFKNNRRELPDIQFIKSLIDAYDKSRSQASDYLDEVIDYIMVVKGYAPTEAGRLKEQILENKLIIMDEDSAVEAITPHIEITAVKDHYERLYRDIFDSGQAVDKSLDKFGAAPSGIALRFLYSGLDLKCSAIESEFRRGFERLLYFIDTYIEQAHNKRFDGCDIEIIFNRDKTIDEESMIQSAMQSKDIISNKTIIANHPWVTDVEEEMKRLEEQKEQEINSIDFNNVPIEDDNG